MKTNNLCLFAAFSKGGCLHYSLLIVKMLSYTMNSSSLTISYLIAVFVSLVFLSFLLLSKIAKTKKDNANRNLNIVLKIASFILVGVFILRYMLSSDSVRNTSNLLNGIFGNNQVANGFAFVLLLLYFPALLITILRSFIDIKTLRLLNKWFAFPISVISFLLMFVLAKGFEDFSNIDLINWMVLVLFAIEIGTMLSVSTINFVKDFKTDIRNNTKQDTLYVVLVGLLALIYCAPAYSLQYLFGSYSLKTYIIDLSFYHRIFVYVVLLIPVAIYLIYWHRSDEERKVVMLILTLGCLTSFSIDFKIIDMFTFTPEFSVNVTSLPLHLCHTAMYTVPLCIIFKKNKFFKNLFYFTYFINVFGALCAILAPNYGDSIASNLFGTGLWVFWINHFDAMMMPLLAVAFKIFARPKFKYMMWSLFFFAIYYVCILWLDVWFANYNPNVDYLFLNSTFIPDKAGNFIEQLIMVPAQFSAGGLTFKFYPIYQTLFFVVYIAVAFSMWYIYEIGFKIADSYRDIYDRKQIIKREKLEFLSNSKTVKGDAIMEQKHEAELVFKDFSKKYGNSDVFSADHVNLDVHAGEIFGFLGPNGAGKSTCIKTAIGIQPITSGQIIVCGYDVKAQPVEAKKLIGYVPDHYALYEKLTGREYINYIADLYGVSKEDRNARIAKYIDLFELYQAFDNRMQTYSHGMKQKIAIMAALVHNPKIWILDEPLTGLDPNSIYQVKECMKQHAAEGNIVFFSSHIIDVVEKMCNRIAVIKKGKILAVRNVADVEKESSLEAYYMNLVGDNGDED